jgi:serine/threonine-protein kinase HipA
LGLHDGDNAATGHGYPDIVDFILRSATNVSQNLQELYRRVAFNICVGNSDDHFRNHGFILTPKGWTLSPAYDMNPTQNDYQSLLISSTSNKSDLSVLRSAHEEYMLDGSVAERIISEVTTAVKEWRSMAARLGIAKRETDMFGRVFEKRMNKEAR